MVIIIIVLVALFFWIAEKITVTGGNNTFNVEVLSNVKETKQTA